MQSSFFKNKQNCFLIAEIGVNHNGSLKIAKKLIRLAKKIGMDAVKFQSFKASKLSSKETRLTNYQKKNLTKKLTHYQMLKNLELTEKDQKNLFNYCKKMKIEFISTPFDLDSAKFLNSLGVKYFKTASPDLHDFFLHKYLSKLNKKIIISTGMSNQKEIEQCLKLYKKKSNIALLHCVSSYPANHKSINMRALNILRKYTSNIGFSDHTLDNLASVVAISFGSKIIEKHFTLDKKMEGPDHKFSLDPNELKLFKEKIRETEVIMGKEEKKCQIDEKLNKQITVKNIFAKRKIYKGKKINESDLYLKRSGNGLMGSEIHKIINKVSKKNILANNKIKKIYLR